VPVRCYGTDELNRVFEKEIEGEGNFRPEEQDWQRVRAVVGQPRKFPAASAKAHRLLGVWGVSEPAALLASGSDELLVSREKTTRATIAVARMNCAKIYISHRGTEVEG